MFLRFRFSHKRAVLIVATTLVTVGLITGCKKDTREKIDLSTIHTTAAQETMAPETTSSPFVETTTAAAEPTSTATGGAANTTKKPSGSSVKNITTKLLTYTAGSISIQYPSVLNLDDTQKTASLDTLLKDNALSIAKARELDGSRDSLTVTCEVLSADRNRITAVYKGILTKKDAPYPVNVFYTNTIDVNKAENIQLKKYADPYTMAGYVLSGDCTFYGAAPELTTALMEAKNSTTLQQYTTLFTNADFPFQGTFPTSFSYEYEGSIFFSIPVAHALGDYAIVVYTPDTK